MGAIVSFKRGRIAHAGGGRNFYSESHGQKLFREKATPRRWENPDPPGLRSARNSAVKALATLFARFEVVRLCNDRFRNAT